MFRFGRMPNIRQHKRSFFAYVCQICHICHFSRNGPVIVKE